MENIVRFVLRIPDDLYEALKEAAAKESRSVNGHVIYLLRQALGL